MYIVKEITTKKDMKAFVKLPFSIFKKEPNWVPPLVNEELASFDKHKNPVFETSEAWFYLAYDTSERVVGRIAVMVNHTEIEKQKIRKVRFGWLDMYDDVEITKALIQKAIDKAKELQLEYIEGPMGFSNMDKVGVMTEGFEYLGNMMTWYSMPYYREHLETLGMKKEKGFVETYFLMENVNYESFQRTSKLVQKRYGVRSIPIKSTKDVMKYVDKMFELFNNSYSKLSSFVPISQKQQDYFKNKFVPFLNPEYIKFVENEKGELVCFAIVMPSFSKALKKANGSLFPFGFWHLLQAKRKNDTVDFYLIGVDPEYLNKGLPAVVFEEFYKVFKKNGVKKCVITPELEDNLAIQQLWKNFSPVDFARRATYRLNARSNARNSKKVILEG